MPAPGSAARGHVHDQERGDRAADDSAREGQRRPAVVIYQDTFNSLWNEYDLVQKEEAVALATDYLERFQDFLDSQSRCAP